MATKHPTGTGRIEGAWRGEINKRWAAFKRSTITRLRDVNKAAVLTNAAEPFAMDASQIRSYMVFLNSEIDRLLLVTDQAPNWQAEYQLQSYTRGVGDATKALMAQSAQIAPTAAEVAAGAQLQAFTASPTLGGSTSLPIHQDALEFLYQRSYTSLKGWTDAMARETRQILMDGLSEGKGIAEVVRDMVNRQNVSRSRARVIARTETIQAYQRSNINETQRVAEETGEEILMQWVTASDERVRPLHARWHGTKVSPEENSKRINKSPWQCRCSQVPVISGFENKRRDERLKQERAKMLDESNG